MAIFRQLFGVNRIHPLTVSSFFDTLGFLRIYTTVEAEVILPDGNAGYSSDVLGYGDFDIRITVFSARTSHYVTDFFLRHYCPSSCK
jgi:hypothetical protein